MYKICFSGMTRSPLIASVGATLLLYACSFKNFDYLQEGAVSEGGATGNGGGQSETGGRVTSGGSGEGASSGSGGSKSGGGSSGMGGGAFGGSAGHGGGGDGNGGDGADAGGGGDGGNAGAGASGGAGGDGGVGVVGGAGGAGGTPSTGGVGTGGTSTGGTGGAVGSSVLLNPSFEQALAVGWKVDPPSAADPTIRHVYQQYPPNGAKAYEGFYELASWHMADEYTVDVYQTLTSLPDGNYTFKGYFASDRTRGVTMFARNCGSPDRTQVAPTSSATYFPVTLAAIEVSGGTCEVGFSIHNVAQDWVLADMFTFEKDP